MIKVGLDQTPPMVGLALRFSTAALVLGGIILWKRRKVPFDRASIQNYLVVGLITMAISYLCTYWAEKFISSGLTSILWAALPIAVGVFARFMIPDERMRHVQILAVILSLAGVIAILSDQQLIFSPEMLLGGLIALTGVVISALSNVFLKIRSKPYDSLALTAMAMAIAAGVHLIGATVFGEWRKLVWDFKNIGSATYLGIFGSAIAFYFFYDLLKQINVVKLSLVTFITPVFATLIGAYWLKEIITWREIAGMIFIFVGLFLYDWNKYLVLIKIRSRRNPHARKN